MNYYIEVQRVDFEDYPVGKPTNIGTFETMEEAEKFLEESPRFVKQILWGMDYWIPNQRTYGARATVMVRDTYNLFTTPEKYNERGF